MRYIHAIAKVCRVKIQYACCCRIKMISAFTAQDCSHQWTAVLVINETFIKGTSTLFFFFQNNFIESWKHIQILLSRKTLQITWIMQLLTILISRPLCLYQKTIAANAAGWRKSQKVRKMKRTRLCATFAKRNGSTMDFTALLR